ncbi:MAG: hypothetical protein MJ123_12270 [Lachnospiraceae bacterium]|nr:hypothetical protein [Oscillospiraceae bacterium]MCQ2525101.1 hypothetical protein [Lachnospiraceae bacterium]
MRSQKVREADELSEDLAAEEREDLMFVWDKVKELPEKYTISHAVNSLSFEESILSGKTYIMDMAPTTESNFRTFAVSVLNDNSFSKVIGKEKVK